MSGAMIAPDPAHRGGHAIIRIPGGAGPGLEDPRFRLSRDGYDAGMLGPAGWQVADALLAPLAAEAESEDLILRVGPSVVDRVESGVVMLAVPALGFAAPVFWPEIPLSRGGRASAGVALPANAEAATPVQPRQQVEAAAAAPSGAARAALAAPTSTYQTIAPPAGRPPRTAAVADALLAPLAAEGEDVILSARPTVVDSVPSGVVIRAVPTLGFDAPVFWPEIPLSRGSNASAEIAPLLNAEAATPIQARQQVAAAEAAPRGAADAAFAAPTSTSQATAPPFVPPPPTAAAAPGGDHTGAARPRSLLPLAAAAVLLLAALGGGAWWALQRPAQGNAPATTQAPSAQAPAPSAAPPAAPPQAAVGPRDCTHGSVADTVACAADADALAAAAQRRWDAGQADQGLVLLQIAADRGSGAAALRLAQLYDPDTFRPGGPIPQPNAREAAQYYRRAVLAHQDAATAPRAALHQRLQTAAADGDRLAGLTLKDFWP